MTKRCRFQLQRLRDAQVWARLSELALNRRTPLHQAATESWMAVSKAENAYYANPVAGDDALHAALVRATEAYRAAGRAGGVV